eukprot:9622124-Heterocapsa_arctica.AAC.1
MAERPLKTAEGPATARSEPETPATPERDWATARAGPPKVREGALPIGPTRAAARGPRRAATAPMAPTRGAATLKRSRPKSTPPMTLRPLESAFTILPSSTWTCEVRRSFHSCGISKMPASFTSPAKSNQVASRRAP